MCLLQEKGEAIPVRWVAPHNFTQNIPEGVDFRVMLTFFEFYETLLSFVLFKLYGDLGVRYPLPTAVCDGEGSSNVSGRATLHPTLGGKATSVLAANLSALQMALSEASKGNAAAEAVKDALNEEDGSRGNVNEATTSTKSKAEKKKQKKLMQTIDEALKDVDQDDDDDEEGEDYDEANEEDSTPIAAPLREALEAIDDSAIERDGDDVAIITSPDAIRRHQLFANLTFYLSREVPRGYLELIILSYGGKVGWEGQDSPIKMDDSSVTHHIVDRPKLLPNYSKLPKNREYVQPQWLLDSANFGFVLPVERYGVGHDLPPHLSPWVDDSEEGYVPKYKEEIERLKNGEVLEDSGDEASTRAEDQVDSEANDDKALVKNAAVESESEGSSSDDEGGDGEEEEEDEVDDDKANEKAKSKKQAEVSPFNLK